MKSVHDLIDLTGRVALVTGGAGHIGYAACEALGELGATVCVLDLNLEVVEDAVCRLKSKGYDAVSLPFDLEGTENFHDVVESVSMQNERLDILVNNAAFVGTSDLSGWAEPFEKQGPEAWDRAMDVNLKAPFFLTQALSPLLKASGNGSVINVASIYGVTGPDWSLYEGTDMSNPAAYGVSKGGMVQLTRWLATTLAPHVRVNAISPGGVERGQPETFQNRYVARTPLARMASEEDFKGVIALLASDLSAYITGQNIMVDGGWGVW